LASDSRGAVASREESATCCLSLGRSRSARPGPSTATLGALGKNCAKVGPVGGRVIVSMCSLCYPCRRTLTMTVENRVGAWARGKEGRERRWLGQISASVFAVGRGGVWSSAAREGVEFTRPSSWKNPSVTTPSLPHPQQGGCRPRARQQPGEQAGKASK
jgi:hypothetical protein